MQIAWRSRGGVADTGSTTGDDRSQAQASTAAADRAARIAAADLATVELAQADPRAFAPLYTQYAPIVLNYCRRRMADPDAAADATSLIFTRALAGLPSFHPDPARSGSTFRSWLFTIAHNVVIDTRRRHRPHVSLDRPAGAGSEASSGDPRWLTDPSASPEELAIRASHHSLNPDTPSAPPAFTPVRRQLRTGPSRRIRPSIRNSGRRSGGFGTPQGRTNHTTEQLVNAGQCAGRL